MQKAVSAHQHVYHRSPLQGLSSDIHRLFTQKTEQAPLAALHELAHRSDEAMEDSGLKHQDFVRPQLGTEPMLRIMQMVQRMVKPLLQPPSVAPPGVPPRGLVALACHHDAVHYCRKYCSCWKGMTKCLSRHQNEIAPQCSHLLELSGILQAAPSERSMNSPPAAESITKEDAEMGETTDDETTKPAENAAMYASSQPAEAAARPSALHLTTSKDGSLKSSQLKSVQTLPLSVQASLQRVHEKLSQDIEATHKAIAKDVAPMANPHGKAPSKDMVEGTPAYLTGDQEAPQGEKAMGGWTMRVYTEEQQKRLGIDEEGRAAPVKPLTNPETVNAKTQEEGASQSLHARIKAALDQLQAKATAAHLGWLPCVALGACVVLVVLASLCSRRKSRALSHEYARLANSAPVELGSSADQI